MHGNRVGNGTDFLGALAGNPLVEERKKKGRGGRGKTHEVIQLVNVARNYSLLTLERSDTVSLIIWVLRFAGHVDTTFAGGSAGRAVTQETVSRARLQLDEKELHPLYTKELRHDREKKR
jgi:hypothetical protein